MKPGDVRKGLQAVRLQQMGDPVTQTTNQEVELSR